MKNILTIVFFLLFGSVTRTELMEVDLKIMSNPKGGWRYEVSDGDKREFKSDAELGTYLKQLSNPFDSIFLTMESEDDVPIDQLARILTLAKANPQGISVKSIILDKKFFNKER